MKTNANEFSNFTHVVIIGIDDYSQGSFTNLSSPVYDSSRLYNALTSKYGCSIPEENIKLFTTAVTKSQVLEYLVMKASNVNATEILLLYFAGHGINADGDFFLCMPDTRIDNLNETAISGKDFDKILDKFNGRGVLIILDCCESAGFAEYAPGALRQIGDNEFRLLLSSTRKNQNSWELPGISGTIFTNILLNVINGTEVTDTPGMVYFSDLFNHLQKRVSEELEHNFQKVPIQEPIFAGAYSQDPLLFVHKNLTLEKIAVKTIRYSKEQLQKRIRKIAFGTMITAFLILGLFYTFIEKHEYAVADTERLTIYQGYPGVNVFGFPKAIWTFDIKITDLDEKSDLRQGLPLAANLGKTVIPLVLDNLKLYKKAELLVNSGRDSLARQILVGNIRDIPETELARSLAQLEAISQPSDTVFLLELFKRPKTTISVKQKVLGILSKHAPKKSIALALGWRLNPVDDTYTTREILKHINAKDTASLRRYLSEVLMIAEVGNVITDVLGFAMENRIIIDNAALLNVARNTNSNDGIPVGHYARLMCLNINDSLKAFLDTQYTKLLAGKGGDIYKINWALHVLSISETTNDCSYYEKFLKIRAFAAIKVMTRRCPDLLLKNKSNAGFREWILSDADANRELAKYGLVSFEEIMQAYRKKKYYIEGDKLVEGLSYLNEKKAVPFLVGLAAFDEQDVSPGDRNREEAIKALQKLDSSNSIVETLIHDMWGNIQTLAYRWQYERSPKRTLDTLLRLMEGEEINMISEVLCDKIPPSYFLDRLRENLRGTGNKRLNSACIIAMFGSPSEVTPLLRDVDVDFRKTVAEFVAYNKHAPEIYELLVDKIKFPNEQISFLKRQLFVRNRILKTYNGVNDADKEWCRDLLYTRYKDDMKSGLYDFYRYGL